MNLEENIEFDAMLYYVDGISPYSIPSYFRLDLGLTWHVNEDLDFSVIGQNLLDSSRLEYYDPVYKVTEVQRAVLAKITYRF